MKREQQQNTYNQKSTNHNAAGTQLSDVSQESQTQSVQGNRQESAEQAANEQASQEDMRDRQALRNQGNALRSKGDYDKRAKDEEKDEENESDGLDKLKQQAVKNVTAAGAKEAAKTALMTKLKVKFAQFLAFMQNTSVAAITSVTLVFTTMFGGILASVFNSLTSGQKDTNFVDCTVYIDKAMIGTSGESVDQSKLERQNAKRIYSTLYYYGLRPEQCFAVLGNWEVESGLDPTAVETIFDEPFMLGYDKQRAIKVDFVLRKWNKEYAELHPNIKRNGIGLGQWTNGRNKDLLSYAKFYGMEYFTDDLNGSSELECMWYDLDVQLAFALDTASVGDSKASWFESWKELGSEEWDGDKNTTIPFKGIKCWSSTTQKNGTFPDEDIESHPVGENNQENTIGSDTEDDYYKDDDRKAANEEATKDLAAQIDEILDAHKPSDYATAYSNGVDEANAAAKKEYIKRWKNRYRYHLYKLTVERFTKQFMDEWEGIPGDSSITTRTDEALKFYEEWWKEAQKKADEGEPNYYVGADDATDSGDYFFHVEEGYASGILDVMNKTKNNNFRLSKVYKYDKNMSECSRVILETRRDLAICAALIAWPNNAASRNNDGTDVYKWIHDQVIEGDTIYQSCDRTICTAVRWSGYDDYYPPGATLNQIQYLVTSPRWIELSWGGDINQLQPGDILIRKDSVAGSSDAEEDGNVHHTVMYIGEHIAQTYADTSLGTVASGSCIVHGSYGERSPAIDVWSSEYSTYHAFRCIYPMESGNSKYVNIGYVK